MILIVELWSFQIGVFGLELEMTAVFAPLTLSFSCPKPSPPSTLPTPPQPPLFPFTVALVVTQVINASGNEECCQG